MTLPDPEVWGGMSEEYFIRAAFPDDAEESQKLCWFVVEADPEKGS